MNGIFNLVVPRVRVYMEPHNTLGENRIHGKNILVDPRVRHLPDLQFSSFPPKTMFLDWPLPTYELPVAAVTN